MRLTTKKLLDRLNTGQRGPYRVVEAATSGDGEVIHLDDERVLVVDEDASLPTVSFEELMDVGGNAEIASWVIEDDAVLDEIVATVAKLK